MLQHLTCLSRSVVEDRENKVDQLRMRHLLMQIMVRIMRITHIFASEESARRGPKDQNSKQRRHVFTTRYIGPDCDHVP